MPVKAIYKTSDTLGIGYGPSFAGVKVDREDKILQFNPDGTLRNVAQLNGLDPVTLSNSSYTLTAAAHAGRTLLFDRAAGVTVTLPAATGTGNVYTFVVKTAATTNQHRINVVGNDAFFGYVIQGNDSDNTVVMWPAGSDADQINLDGATTGGFKGARYVIQDIATDVWSVFGASDASGTEATPFATGQVS